jgi:hypothetical protein
VPAIAVKETPVLAANKSKTKTAKTTEVTA